MARDPKKQWIVAFETAGLDFIARRDDPGGSRECPLRAAPCRRHGNRCLRVTFGEFLDHVRWEDVADDDVARSLLHLLFPEMKGQ